MAKFAKKALIVGAFLGVELFREWYVLRSLGFDSRQFFDWVRGA